MLSISSKSFAKPTPDTHKNTFSPQKAITISHNGQLPLSTTTFQCIKAQKNTKNCLTSQNYLVSEKYSSTTNISNSNFYSIKINGSQTYDSEVSTAAEISSSNESSPSRGSVKTTNSSPFNLGNTFKTGPQLGKTIPQVNFTSLSNTPNNYSAPVRGNDNKGKKKTRRGGRKARLRREKEKSNSNLKPQTEINSNTENEHTQVKYKTELCKNWIETGKCRYSVRCMFAHGHHELVSAQSIPEVPISYKTQLCGKFHKEFYCNYGTRCVYIHDERSLEDLPSSYYGKNLTLLDERMRNSATNSRRLPVFEQLTKDFSQIQDVEEIALGNNCLSNVSNEEKAPINECYSYASDSTDTAEEVAEELSSIFGEIC